MNGFYKVLRIIAIPFVHCFFNIKAYGLENIPKEKGVVLCCNHTSLSDIILLGVLCPRQICFMAKKELFDIPVLKHIFKALGGFPVDRRSSDKGAINHALSICNNGKILGIFPEGTRNRDGAPKKAKAGAAMIALKTGADILPVAIYRSKPQVHIFQKATVRFGEVLKYEEYSNGFEDALSKTAIRATSELIMQKITKLWEKKH
jgi:1-acyl-sn-glycerol-3-phosphate acyltransferase